MVPLSPLRRVYYYFFLNCMHACESRGEIQRTVGRQQQRKTKKDIKKLLPWKNLSYNFTSTLKKHGMKVFCFFSLKPNNCYIVLFCGSLTVGRWMNNENKMTMVRRSNENNRSWRRIVQQKKRPEVCESSWRPTLELCKRSI